MSYLRGHTYCERSSKQSCLCCSLVLILFAWINRVKTAASALGFSSRLPTYASGGVSSQSMFTTIGSRPVRSISTSFTWAGPTWMPRARFGATLAKGSATCGPRRIPLIGQTLEE